MRIASSTIYSEQVGAIDNQSSLLQTIGQQLSSGKSLQRPSDDPTGIAADLSVRTTIGSEDTAASSAQNASNVLSTMDGSLSGLTAVLQKARELAITGASDVLSNTQRADIANQVDGLLHQAIGYANTNVGGVYIFAGSKFPNAAPVTTNGTPITSVVANANSEGSGQVFVNGQKVDLGTNLQQAFNMNGSDNSLSVFQTLINLRNTLQGSGPTTIDGTGTSLNAPIIDQSATQLNVAGTVLTAAGSALNSASLATKITPDTSGNISFTIDGSPQSFFFTFAPATTIGAVVAAVNAQTAVTGVTATFDQQSQKFSLSSQTAFHVSDQASAGAANTANFVAAMGLTQQADVVNSLSRQIGDVDTVLNHTLNTRATVGGRIQNLGSTTGALNARATTDTKVQSGLEDTDIAKATTQFSLSQTALQAAYATTTRLESKDLFDFL